MKGIENPPNKESVEKGKNVEIILKIIRHGERDKDGRLIDYGREVTRQRAKESGYNPNNFDLIKAIGSDSGRKDGVGMRSLETAQIFTNELTGNDMGIAKIEPILNYETLVTKSPFNHKDIYDSLLPNNYEELSDEEKAVAALKAHTGTVDHHIRSSNPAAVEYRKEMAGAYAALIEHYQEVLTRLNNGSKILLPAGTHGGMMEFLLQEALVRKNTEGEAQRGFNSLEEIGGVFAPSEGYDLDIRTDGQGHFLPIQVFFDNQDREVESTGPMYLDEGKIRELADFYRQIHSKKT